VPVVENLEDLWLVSKLQRERKAKEQAAKQRRLAQLQVNRLLWLLPKLMLVFCLQQGWHLV
jgi:hypothetical protein